MCERGEGVPGLEKECGEGDVMCGFGRGVGIFESEGGDGMCG